MSISRLLIAFLLTLGTAGIGVEAAESGWTLRMYGVLVDSSADSRTSATGVVASVDVGGGFGIAGEYRLSDRFGLELSTLFAGLDMETAVSGPGGSSSQSLQFGMLPLTVGMTLHLNPGRRTDIFVAPTVSHVSYFELETRFAWNGASMTVDETSDIALGAAFGVDVPVGKGKWTVCTGLRYMKTDTNEAAVDPLMVTLGVGRRF